ncbi:hypothetical protein EL22_26035 [Halostagnicola sp. A56]|nr:hypothetical protein EL22_26035 [Halostagnicola sp. A56]
MWTYELAKRRHRQVDERSPASVSNETAPTSTGGRKQMTPLTRTVLVSNYSSVASIDKCGWWEFQTIPDRFEDEEWDDSSTCHNNVRVSF